ncbi:MAG: argininosuccinate lyase, partial [Candidatus Dormiibacterota bacterium]
LTVLKGLPLSYDRDLQEDRQHLFMAVGSVQESLVVLAELLGAVRFNRPALAAAAADPELLATDLAEWLVGRGVPFRLAHGMVARLVREADSRRLGLDVVVREAWQRLGFSSESDGQQLFEPSRSLRKREQPGSPGPRRTRAAIADAALRVADHRAWARSLRRRLPA